MSSARLSRRVVLQSAISAAALAATVSVAEAQESTVKFQLDWRFEGPAAMFLVPAAKGYFKDEKLNVVIDAGNGSGSTVTRVASGSYDMGFADMASLMEFWANNPTAPNKPVAVMMVYNDTPAAVLTLKKSGIKTPADLNGKKLGAPVFDAGRRAFPIFAKANNVQNVQWTSMDPPLRETMLKNGDVDAITGFSFTSLLNLEARGVKADEVTILPYPKFGVKMYGNCIIASESFLKNNPDKVRAFLRAYSKGMKDVIADPKAAIATVKARDGIINESLEQRRLQMTLTETVLTADARTDTFGDLNPARLSLMASQVSDAFNTKTRVDPTVVWNGSFLPPAADRNIFAAVKK